MANVSRSSADLNCVIHSATEFIARRGRRSHTKREEPSTQEIDPEIVRKAGEVSAILPACDHSNAFELTYFFTALFNQVSDDVFRTTWNAMTSDMREYVTDQMHEVGSEGMRGSKMLTVCLGMERALTGDLWEEAFDSEEEWTDSEEEEWSDSDEE